MSGFEFCNEVHFFHGKAFGKIKLDGKEPQFSTDTIYIANSSTPKKLSFPVRKEDNTLVYEIINSLENQLDASLRKLTPKHALNRDAPNTYATLLKYRKENPNTSFLRPNYQNNDSGEVTAWFKGSDKTEIYTWDGTPIASADQLGTGDYQFIIKTSLVYFGAHTSCGAIANLQARIVGLRYRPAVKVIHNFAWDFNSDEPAAQKQ